MMKGVYKYVIAILLSSTAAAIQLAPRSESPRAVSLPIQRSHVDPEAALLRDRNRLRKRQDNSVLVELDNHINLYSVNFTLGTPPQQLSLHIDTGSSDLWVNLPTSPYCEQGGCQGGTYDAGASSTHQVVNTEFDVSYVDGSAASGAYALDTLGIAGVSLDDFQFGTGETSTLYQGVMGIGYQLNEVQVNRAGGQPYPNLPVALKNAGHIASTAYSLWLNDLSADNGEILFGAVDAAKYSGSLQTVPVIDSDGVFSIFVIALTGLNVNGRALDSSNLPLAVLLDSGASLSYLPTDLLTPIFEEVNAVWNDDTGAAYAPCRLAELDRTIQFNFSGAVISVPYSELFIPVTSGPGTGPRFENGDEACYFGISETGDHISILGDTFLRSAYVVYDLENNEISLANTVFNAKNSDVQEISGSNGAVPAATLVADPVTDVTYNADDGGRIGGPSSSTNVASGRTIASDFALFVALLAASLTAF